MAERYVLVKTPNENQPRLVPEQSVGQELWLQEQVKLHTELIPAADLDLRTPLLVVGRETGLGDAGAADLIAVDMTGEVLVVEFKRGPDNPDARRVVAQLLDYGAQMYGMRFEEFDRAVARPYFNSERCHAVELKGNSLEEAALSLWGRSEEESEEGPAEFDVSRFREKLGQRLANGHFTYVVVSTRITDRVRSVLEYLNRTASFRAFGVELSHFADGGISVFVPRTIGASSQVEQPTHVSRDEFLAQLTPHGREIFEYLLDRLENTGERIYWGTVGFSFRPVFGSQSASIVYGYPSGDRNDADLLQVYFPQLENALLHNRAPSEVYRRATEGLPGFTYTPSRKTGNIRLTELFMTEHVDILIAAVEGLLQARDEGYAGSQPSSG